MKITKRQLRKIIRETRSNGMVECPDPESAMPCPIQTAAELRSAGATGDDVLHWVQLLVAEFTAGTSAGDHVEDVEFGFTGDVGELEGDEAFGIGYEAGRGGL